MANRIFHDLGTYSRDRVLISGSFAPNGSSALAATSTYGTGFTVAYTSTGLYTITFADSYAQLEAFVCTLQLASGADTFLQAGSYSSANKTITIRNWDVSGAAVADIAADANNRINFIAVFANTAATI